MKLLPTSGQDKKLFLISLIIAFVVNIGQILRIGSVGNLIGYFINILITAVIVMVIIRLVLWAAKKLGLTK